jgi:hypothetical protein
MTPTARTIAILNRWCGQADAVDRTSEPLKELWARTKDHHSAVPFFDSLQKAQGAEQLVDALVQEFRKEPARKINFDLTNLNPSGGTILLVDDLFVAIRQSPPDDETEAKAWLSPEAHDALVSDIVARLTPVIRESIAANPQKAGKDGGSE